MNSKRKSLVALGIFLVVTAIIVVSIFFLLQQKGTALFQATRTCKTEFETELVASREYVVFPDWTISAHFNENEKLLVYFSAPNKEGIPNGDEVLALMFVDIVDPQGGNTTFNVSFTETTFEVKLQSNDGGLDEVTPLTEVGGITQYEGEYLVRVYTWQGLVPYYYPVDATMRRIELYRGEPTLLYTVEVCYYGAEPLYEVKLRSNEGDLLDSQPVLEQNGVLSYQSSDNSLSSVVVTWAGGSEQINVED